jgi:hypothetical protein
MTGFAHSAPYAATPHTAMAQRVAKNAHRPSLFEYGAYILAPSKRFMLHGNYSTPCIL